MEDGRMVGATVVGRTEILQHQEDIPHSNMGIQWIVHQSKGGRGDATSPSPPFCQVAGTKSM